MTNKSHIEEINKSKEKIHKVSMIARKNMSLTGITDVVSFDANEILLETTIGALMIRGEQLHINRLNLNENEVDIDGHIDGMVYSDVEKKNKNGNGILKRLFG